MGVRIRLTEEQLRGIFATGAASCSRSTVVESAPADVAARIEPLLASASGGAVTRVDATTLYADRTGAFIAEGWQAKLTTFGPKTTVDLRAARAVRPWVVLTTWFLVTPALGVGAAATLFVFLTHPPVFAPGFVFVTVLMGAVFAIMAIAGALGRAWSVRAYEKLGEIEAGLEGSDAGATYRS
jgi:peptidoglycan/LPS O-acetylase OafA/YrhL